MTRNQMIDEAARRKMPEDEFDWLVRENSDEWFRRMYGHVATIEEQEFVCRNSVAAVRAEFRKIADDRR